MRKQITTVLSSTILGVTCLIGLSSTALAVDGVILIDQNRAIAGNVTPGDDPGFPVQIKTSGSYRLAGNLKVSNENTTAIEITADNVTLDLNGFTISGNTVCNLDPGQGQPPFCAPTGSGIGITAGASNQGISVINGTVQRMGSIGISLLSSLSRVENIRATSNAVAGIGVGSGSTVIGNISAFNGNRGIVALGGSTILNNTVYSNIGEGLHLQQPTGYAFNVLFGNNNGGSQVTGGVQMGSNVCGFALCP